MIQQESKIQDSLALAEKVETEGAGTVSFLLRLAEVVVTKRFGIRVPTMITVQRLSREQIDSPLIIYCVTDMVFEDIVVIIVRML